MHYGPCLVLTMISTNRIQKKEEKKSDQMRLFEGV